MTDAGVFMDLLKIVTDIKKPIQISVGEKDWTIDVPGKKLVKGKATNAELTIGLAEVDFKNLQT